MSSQVRIHDAGLTLPLAADWREGLESNDEAWARDGGYLVGRAGSESLFIDWEQWDALGSGPASTDLEEQEWWSAEHERLTRLIGVGKEEVYVEHLGHVGGTSMGMRFLVNGAELDVAPGSREAVARIFEGGRRLSPLVFRVAQRVGEFAADQQHTRGQQLTLVARLKESGALVRQFPELRSRLTLALSPYLETFMVEQPQEFSAKWVKEDGEDRASLQLFIKGDSKPLPVDGLDEASPIVDLGGRRTILLTPGAREVATQARGLQRARRKRLDPAVLRNPLALLGDGADTEGVDFSDYALEDFSHRVVGFEVAARPAIAPVNSPTTPWYERDGEAARFVFTASTPDGTSVQIELPSREEALQVAALTERAVSEGSATLEVQGQRLLPSPQLPEQLRGLVRLADQAAAASAPTEAPETAARPVRLQPVLEEVVAAPPEPAQPLPADLEALVPWSTLEGMLAPQVRLKAHQRTGIAWLWHRYTGGQTGALLADDMGLGKTLQLASFIALAKSAPRKSAAKKPTLIVAPVILIPNWSSELTKFFAGDFPGRVIELRDEVLRSHRTPTGALDRDRIRTFDIVITSYESLAKYATSLLGIDWDVVVLDEAHRIKNRGTSFSIAARGLSGLDDPERPRKFDFGICATGTPVENNVHDLWALYDFISPGAPFGSYQQFAERYSDHEEAPRALAVELKVGSAESSLFRRTKAEVLPHELPGKTYRSIPIEMTAHQREQERIITSARSKRGGFFTILQSLQKLYQHPWLLEEGDRAKRRDLHEAVATSPKLAECLRLLTQIRERGEKALVFTLWTDMQWLLKNVFEAMLGVPDVSIINGDPRNRARALSSIDRFSSSAGFEVMVLSPLAAGTGLNIVAANHVIHYGRWWNPAKEDQATDRAYRIGQTRHVTVYYPVLHHPGRPDVGFDVKLDELVARKRDMARALLEPVDGDDLQQSEFEAMEPET